MNDQEIIAPLGPSSTVGGEGGNPPAVEMPLNPAGRVNGARTKWCSGCNQVLPIDSFPIATTKKISEGVVKRYRSRRRVCGECFKRTKKNSKKRQRERLSGKLQEVLASMASKKHIDVAHVSEVAAAFTRKLGGVEKATERWAANMAVADELAPGKRDTIKNYEGWANLILKSTENRQTAPDVANMSEEDLIREARAILAAQDQDQSVERLSGAN